MLAVDIILGGILGLSLFRVSVILGELYGFWADLLFTGTMLVIGLVVLTILPGDQDTGIRYLAFAVPVLLIICFLLIWVRKLCNRFRANKKKTQCYDETLDNGETGS